MRRRLFLPVATTALLLVLPTAAQAADHLFDGATAEGAAQRGFTNPVAANPSGVSGPAAQPGTVPGLGNPGAGADTGTPAFSAEDLAERLAARSNGHGPSTD